MIRVLVIDDDAERRQLLRLWLVSAGHDVTALPPVTLEADVEALVRRTRPDVALVAAGRDAQGIGVLTWMRTLGVTGILLADGAGDPRGWDGPILPVPVSGPAALSLVASAMGSAPSPGGAPPAPVPAPVPTAAPTRPPPTGLPQTTKGHVLVVDDEEDLRELLVRQLTVLGYRADAAPDGPSALRIARQGVADAILLDIDMPGMDGHDVLRTLRADRATASLPVVLLTARTQGSDVAAALSLGADDYVRKPFSLTEVAARLASAINRARRLEPLIDLRDVLLPQAPAVPDFLQAALVHQPCAGAAAGGDLHVVGPGPHGTTFVVVGDVGGHGTQVAALAAHLRLVVTNHVPTSPDPAALLAALNTSVVATGDDPDGAATMATMVCLQFDPAAGLVLAATAGHPAPLLVPGGDPLPVEAGTPLGVVEQPDYPVTTMRLPAGSTLLLSTDGLTEGRRHGRGEMFGDNALASVVADYPVADRAHPSPHGLVDAVIAAHARWVDGPLADDVTVLALTLSDEWTDQQVREPGQILR